MDVEKSPAWQLPRRPRRRVTRYVVGIVVFILCLWKFSQTVHSSNRFTKIQFAFNRDSSQTLDQLDRLAEVKKEFLHAWKGYKEHAWMSDALLSVSGGHTTQFCGWSATLVDSLDTLWIMDLRDEFDKAVEAVTTIDFQGSAESCEVNMFESTIRYLGGILAAYDLSQDHRLLPKIQELGELLLRAFDTSNGMPCNHCKFPPKNSTEELKAGDNVSMADMASFYLEFARLSQITKDRRFMRPVEFVTRVFEQAQDRTTIPGLWPDMVNASSIDGPDPRFVAKGGTYSLGALSDSSYEYLVKGHLLMGGTTKRYKNMWRKASSAIRQRLLFRAYLPQAQANDSNILFSGLASKTARSRYPTFEARTQHLACFAGGMFAMASRIFNRPADLFIGEGLTNGCVWAYDQSPTGIMPETFGLLKCPGTAREQCEWNATTWAIASGTPEECIGQPCDNWRRPFPLGYLNSIDEHYGLRPEAIESVFVLFRVTGDPKWRDVGWRMFQSIIKSTRTQYGHAALGTSLRVSNRTVWDGNHYVHVMSAPQRDEMESFWLAETLKYFWLLFSDTNLINLDEWVLNTEAHPLKLDKALRGFP